MSFKISGFFITDIEIIAKWDNAKTAERGKK